MTFTRAALHELDRRAVNEFGMPILVLMENAGRAVAERLLAHRKDNSRVIVICGPGNNGGDGLVCARWLWNARVDVLVLLMADRQKFTQAAATSLAIVDRMNIPVEIISPGHAELRDWLVEGEPNDLIVDAIFGTGLSRPIEGLTAETIRAINTSARWITAIDIPSGIDADTGRVLGAAVEAKETISFCGTKPGFAHAAKYTGKITIADIGIPRILLEDLASGK